MYAIRKDKKKSQEEFGKMIGVTRSAICNYEGGTRPVGEQVILAVCRAFSVNELWLRTGVGNPYNSEDGGVIDRIITEYRCSKFEGDFLKSYFQMSEDERRQFVECAYRLLAPFIKGMVGSNPFADYFAATYGIDSPQAIKARAESVAAAEAAYEKSLGIAPSTDASPSNTTDGTSGKVENTG